MNPLARQNRCLSESECAVVIALHAEGYNQSQLAERFRVVASTISRVLLRYNETGINTRRRGQGRRRITNPRQDRFIRLQALRQRFTTSSFIQTEFLERYEFPISQSTVTRRLAENDLKPRRAATGPLLTRRHRRLRLQFAREHLNWQVEDWTRILFSDESRFSLFFNDRRNMVFRRQGERYAQCNIVGTVSFGGGSVMVWGGISLDGRTELVIVDGGRVTAHRYITEILDPHVIPYAPFVGENFMLMHDNARPHVAIVVQQYLREVNIETMNWPPRSPDLNPIEHLWDIMGRRIRALPHRPTTLNELSERLIQIWVNIDQEVIRGLILSMPRRCQEVIAARGGNTRY